MVLTDFSDWISLLDLENFEEIDALYQSVKQISDLGLFRTVKGRKEGSFIVTASYIDDSLFLASDKEKEALLRFIEKTYCGDEPEEIWYAVEYANKKND